MFLAGDGLRGAGLLAVFFVHASTGAVIAAGAPNLVVGLGPVGALVPHLDLALYIFFILSAYLIGRPYTRALLAGRRLPRARSYVRHRALRILPVFWVLTTVILLRHAWLPDGYPRSMFFSTPLQVAAIYGFLQDYFRSGASALMGPAWSLNPEVGFYIMLPILAAGAAALNLRPGARLPMLLAAVAVIYLASISLRLSTPDIPQWRRTAPVMLFAFMPGLVLAIVEPWLSPLARDHPRAPVVAAALVAGGLVLLALDSLIPNQDPFLEDTIWWRVALMSVIATCMVGGPMLLQWSTGSCWRWLAWAPLRWLGVRSYSFYLLHQAIGFEFAWVYARGVWPSIAIYIAVVLPLTAALAHVSYTFIEAPFLRRKGPPLVAATRAA